LRGAAGRQVVRANEELKMREVLVFDDDHTAMEFVVTVLEQVIQKSREEASTIMM
jgi:ATP-dependent Clp protease adapter protein ClpS